VHYAQHGGYAHRVVAVAADAPSWHSRGMAEYWNHNTA